MRDLNQSLAVGVVLLPDDIMTSFAIHLNREQIRCGGRPEIVLDKERCLPSIPLIMGGLELSKLEHAKKGLDYIRKKFGPISLQAEKYKSLNVSNGYISVLSILLNWQLYDLHRLVVNVYEEFLFYGGLSRSMFFAPYKVNKDTLFLVKNFRTSSSFSNFNPQIVIGFGFLGDLVIFEPLPFFCNRIALCHLGNYGTCQEILYSVEFL